ncbi:MULTISPECIES: CinA family protein [Thiomicrorhabdus]|uniref:CinA family protein n=1 Tax=Thiomicrorhabdus xiamenensis TaxID=2739063 RepID=A0A7D4SZ71_9GAMM|nr:MULTISPECIES: CinA family protein [Thiomicrorhabdus]MBO1924450.1 CinA family protein [Thiomicrorhabdus sp. 6S3-12]QKI89644.1 CinA family protein [Thiomicrorhabdus xiamenensis]
MDFTDQMSALGQKLVEKNETVVTAESCTGGMIAEALTSIGGSTAWFDRAYITYSYESKREMLGVKELTIQKQGAVSQACVEEMVLGALQQSHATVAVACSGIAGPGGGSPQKPVGTVWLAWAKQGHDKVESQCFVFDGDRQAVREQATRAALQGISDLI